MLFDFHSYPYLIQVALSTISEFWQEYNFPPNKETPKIAKINHTISIATVTFITEITDSNRAVTTIFIEML